MFKNIYLFLVQSLLLGSNRISSLDEECISTLSELTILELRENKIAKCVRLVCA